MKNIIIFYEDGSVANIVHSSANTTQIHQAVIVVVPV